VSAPEALDAALTSCRDACGVLCRGERVHFTVVWSLLRPVFKDWLTGKAGHHATPPIEIPVWGAYSWPGKPDVHGLAVYRVTLATFAAFLTLAQEETPPSLTKIEKVAEDCAEVQGVPCDASEFAKVVSPILERDLAKLSRPLTWPPPRGLYLYDWQEGRVEIAEDRVQALEMPAALDKCDLFLDATKAKLWLGRREVKVTPQIVRLCAFLLKRIGRGFTHSDVRDELWPDDAYVPKKRYRRAFERMHKATKGLLKPYIEHSRGAKYSDIREGLRYRLLDTS